MNWKVFKCWGALWTPPRVTGDGLKEIRLVYCDAARTDCIELTDLLLPLIASLGVCVRINKRGGQMRGRPAGRCSVRPPTGCTTQSQFLQHFWLFRFIQGLFATPIWPECSAVSGRCWPKSPERTGLDWIGDKSQTPNIPQPAILFLYLQHL